MRNSSMLAAVAGALVVGACSGKDGGIPADLQNDLDVASSASAVALATSESAGNQVTSAIERTTPHAPRRVAASQRVPRHRPATRSTRAPVEVEEADVSEEVEAQPVEVASAPTYEEATLPSPRPQPVLVSNGGSDGRAVGSDAGRVLGGVIGVVIRGGVVGDIDECDPRTDGRRGRGRRIAINNRIPVIGGTFPGRVVGTFPGSQLSLPGRARF